MTKWEYRIETLPNMHTCEKALGSLGEEGWELISVVQSERFYKLFLKREKSQKPLLG
jgi:hypothetical protein